MTRIARIFDEVLIPNPSHPRNPQFKREVSQNRIAPSPASSILNVVSKTMQALVKRRPEPGLGLEEVPVPDVGPNDVLIRVHKASICGTDVHIYNWDAWAQKTIPVPMVIGHEFVG